MVAGPLAASVQVSPDGFAVLAKVGVLVVVPVIVTPVPTLSTEPLAETVADNALLVS